MREHIDIMRQDGHIWVSCPAEVSFQKVILTLATAVMAGVSEARKGVLWQSCKQLGLRGTLCLAKIRNRQVIGSSLIVGSSLRPACGIIRHLWV